jgi:hypothetical protein
MINQINQSVGGDAAPRSDANPADPLVSPTHMVDEALQAGRGAARPAPRVMRMADVRALEVYIERRRKLAAKIRLENPSLTEEEIEARLEQFGA